MTCFDGCCTIGCGEREAEEARRQLRDMRVSAQPANAPSVNPKGSSSDSYVLNPQQRFFQRFFGETLLSFFGLNFCQGPLNDDEACFERTIPARYKEVRGLDCINAQRCFAEYTTVLVEPAHTQRVTFNFLTGAVQLCQDGVCSVPSDTPDLGRIEYVQPSVPKSEGDPVID